MKHLGKVLVVLCLVLVAVLALASCGEETEHQWDEGKVVVEPTCYAAGAKLYTCTGCGEYKAEPIEKLAHTPVTDAAVAATCQAEGKTAGSHCSVCHVVIEEQKAVARVDHQWDEGKVTREASCTVVGEKVLTCKDCGATKVVALELHSHTTEVLPAVAATCTKSGWTEGSRCTACGLTLVKQELVPAAGHHIVTDEAVAPTCVAVGWTEGSHCDKCGYIEKLQNVIRPTGHTTEVLIPGEAPTYLKDGKTAKIGCRTCGLVLQPQTVIPRLTVEETPAGIMEAAKTLNPGESLPGKLSLRGRITVINTAYSTKYGNVTFTIAVEGTDDTIECFRLKAPGCSLLAVGDVVTVTGTIKNYNGTLEFDAGCTYEMEGMVHPETATLDEILETANRLQSGDTLPGGNYTLTGRIITINTAYSSSYKNITVTIEMEESKTIQCFRMAGGEDLVVGDTITVTGSIKKYNGTVEFDAGCTYEFVSHCEHPSYTDWKSNATDHWKECTVCGAKAEEAAHSYVDGTCVCGKTESSTPVTGTTKVTFTLGTDGTASHNDGTSGSNYTEEQTVDGNTYTLSITGGSQFYTKATDAKGNGCLKLGSSKNVGSFTFTVGDNVDKVYIYVANYKAKTAKITINGGDAQTLTKNSDDGEYDVIEIDTSVTKTVTVATVSGATRAMVNAIVFEIKAN